MFTIKSASVLTVFLFSISPIVFSAVSESKIGKKIAMQGNSNGATACISCHGLKGEGMAPAGFPRLSNLDQRYLSKQLQDFRNGTRKDPIMEPIAKALTKKESAAVSNYFVTLKTSSSNSSKADSALLAQGKKIATIGNWANTIPACFACHGPGGTGVGEHFPALAGQHASYITKQIQAWKSGTRKNDANDLMKVIAVRMSDSEIMAVSAYLASLSAKKN